MRESALSYLICPDCKGELEIDSVKDGSAGILITAVLKCEKCGDSFPIVNGIPRFVPIGNYADSFSFEWSRHARTQFDSYSGVNASEKRFFEETRWPRSLAREVILEVGSGSGRFTEQAAKTGAFVVSFDYSHAVEANYSSNSHLQNVLIVQADIYNMPFRTDSFDRIFCFGVLQHTPDVRKAFLSLPPMLKQGGSLVVDVYENAPLKVALSSKYLLRRVMGGILKSTRPSTLYEVIKNWVELLWPLCIWIIRIPKVGPILNWELLVPVYSKDFPEMKLSTLKEWATLDAFDMLSPMYDSPQTLHDVTQWFREAQLSKIDVVRGYNGIEGHAVR